MNPKMVEYERRMAAAMGVLDDGLLPVSTNKLEKPPASFDDWRDLIAHLRDVTHDRDVYDRCVAIVGERGA